MKTLRASISPREAAEALCAVLDSLSFIRKQDMHIDPSPADRRIGLLARVNVFGRQHTLACALHARSFPEGLDAALYDIHSAATALGCSALPVLIAPVLSPEARAQCHHNHIAYIDLEGNAYLDAGEIFVARRAVYPRTQNTSAEHHAHAHPGIATHTPASQTGSLSC